MLITQNVNLPDDLLNAQIENNLVIFVGAGVSKGPPSNLPGFQALADAINAGMLEQAEEEPIDRFLGRLEKNGAPVRQRIKKIIGNPESKPTDLHKFILSIFQNESDIRIVTTNFDRHLTTVIDEQDFSSLNTFYAPALPLGRDFSGLIYLHGSIDKRLEDLVTTDSGTELSAVTGADGKATIAIPEGSAEAEDRSFASDGCPGGDDGVRTAG